MVQLEFHGAAQTVTGSMHILHLDDGPVALDCGLFQGRRDWARQMNRTCPIEPSRLRGLLLSHAHLDHSGRIPSLVSDGFAGPIAATAATCDLCAVMLADSAHIQEEDAVYWNEHRAKSKAEEIAPLYTLADVQNSQKLFRPVSYGQPYTFAEDCRATFLEAGHILGSALVLIEIGGAKPVRLLYTGDLGRFGQPILRDPATPLPEVDYLVTESLYAGRRHEDVVGMKGDLVRIVNETRAAGGKTIIPAFSVGRTQMIIYYLQQAIASKELQPLPIYVDSPLSAAATAVFRKHPECYDREAEQFWKHDGDIFGNGYIKYLATPDQSRALNDRPEPCVIIAGSGMCEAGRVLHHLKHNVEDRRTTVLVVGYMAENTLGRRISEKRPEVKIFGRMYRLKARVKVLEGFSAHADMAEMQRLLGPLAPRLKAAFAVHGEHDQLEAMKALLTQAGCPQVHAPSPGEKFTL